MKRYVKEYANDKIKAYERIAAESPRLLQECSDRIANIRKAITAYERFQITPDEAIQAILDA